jgi:hypothetical protein
LNPLKKGPIGCPETSVRNYHYALRNNPEEHSSHLSLGVELHVTPCVTPYDDSTLNFSMKFFYQPFAFFPSDFL